MSKQRNNPDPLTPTDQSFSSVSSSVPLPASLHDKIERLAAQIQENGGNGRIILTLMHNHVCMIDIESNMIEGESYQFL